MLMHAFEWQLNPKVFAHVPMPNGLESTLIQVMMCNKPKVVPMNSMHVWESNGMIGAFNLEMFESSPRGEV